MVSPVTLNSFISDLVEWILVPQTRLPEFFCYCSSLLCRGFFCAALTVGWIVRRLGREKNGSARGMQEGEREKSGLQAFALSLFPSFPVRRLPHNNIKSFPTGSRYGGELLQYCRTLLINPLQVFPGFQRICSIRYSMLHSID